MKRNYNYMLFAPLKRALRDFKMINEDDLIGVGVSGGKDSIVLLYALDLLRKISKIKFRIKAISLDLGWDADYSELTDFCDKNEISLDIVPTNIAKVVFDERKESNPCSLCAKMRRGALNSYAKSIGCDKVALGHHQDDAAETFLLSLLYEGRINCFSPLSYLDRTDITIIRPLIYVTEKNIRKIREELSLPLIVNNCPANGKTKREEMKRMIANLKTSNPLALQRIAGAIDKSIWKKDINSN